jgi:hypothetical protein
MGEYLAWLRRLYEHPNSVLTPFGDEEELTDAFERAEDVRREAKRVDARFDQAWAVIDLSRHPEITSVTIPTAMTLVVMKPAFEYWLLSHFEEHDPALSLDQVQQRLGAHIEKYEGKLRNRENALYGSYDYAKAQHSPADQPTICDLIDAMHDSQLRFLGSPPPVHY